MFGSDQTEFEFVWDASTGAVAGYEACIETQDGSRSCYDTPTNRYTFTPPQWKTWFVQVRAFSENKASMSIWSDPSYLFNVNPNPADLNYNGMVDGNDFVNFINEWGKHADE